MRGKAAKRCATHSLVAARSTPPCLWGRLALPTNLPTLSTLLNSMRAITLFLAKRLATAMSALTAMPVCRRWDDGGGGGCYGGGASRQGPLSYA